MCVKNIFQPWFSLRGRFVYMCYCVFVFELCWLVYLCLVIFSNCEGFCLRGRGGGLELLPRPRTAGNAAEHRALASSQPQVATGVRPLDGGGLLVVAAAAT